MLQWGQSEQPGIFRLVHGAQSCLEEVLALERALVSPQMFECARHSSFDPAHLGRLEQVPTPCDSEAGHRRRRAPDHPASLAIFDKGVSTGCSEKLKNRGFSIGLAKGRLKVGAFKKGEDGVMYLPTV